MNDIDLSLLPDFVVETPEHLAELETFLLQLSKTPDDLALLNEIFRPVHTIKGSAQFIGVSIIAKLSHRMEDLLDILRTGSMECTNDMILLFMEIKDRITVLVSELEKTQHENSDIDDLMSKLDVFITGEDNKNTDEAVYHAAEEETNSDDPDKELFDIFKKHQSEYFKKLKTCFERYENNDDLQVLQDCSSIINNLKSSANYMGYQELVDFYTEWLDELANAIENKSDVSFMDIFFMDIASMMPAGVELGVELASDETDDKEVEADKQVEESADDFDMPSIDELDAAVYQSEGPELEAEQTDSEEITYAEMIPDFVVEASEHLFELEELLLQLTHRSDDISLLNEIFRPVHTIKGSAQYIGIARMARLTHQVEDLLDILRESKKVCTPQIIDLLVRARDRMLKLVAELDSDKKELSSIDDLIQEITSYINDDDKELNNEDTVLSNENELQTNDSSSQYSDDTEDELFEIFINHLKERLSRYDSLFYGLKKSNDKSGNINECLDILGNLKSSANYMGYKNLVTIYEDEINILNTLKISFENNDNTFVEQDTGFKDKLISEIPDLAEIFEHDFSAKDIFDEPSNDIQTYVNSSVIDDPSINDELYNRLNNSLNNSHNKKSKSDYETLHHVYDAMVTPDSEKSNKDLVTASTHSRPGKSKSSIVKKSKAESSAKKPNKENIIKRSLRVDSTKIDSLMNQVGELVVDRSYFHQLSNELNELQQELKNNANLEQKEVKAIRVFSYRLGEAISSLSRTSNELQEEVMKMRMLPISHIFNRYPRLIHDLTNNTDKKVNLIVKGEDTELDKMIVEEISDPLIHIIRNAVDHGIESFQQRTENGKKKEGTVVIEAYQESNSIVIEVTDDGRGINHEKVKQKALEKGIYNNAELERMSPRELNQIIMSAGFSTADKVTGTSGRGVGMDVVKQNIEKLNGALEIDSKFGFGTRMRLKIPLTLAIIHALMVRVGAEMFTIPLANVEETVRITENDISTVEGVEVTYLRNQTLPIFRLSNLFSVPTQADNKNLSIVVVNRGGQKTGFVVDELLGQDEVVIKPLADYVQNKSGFSGATIIGDGRISLILDVYELVKISEIKQMKKQKLQTKELRSKLKIKSLVDKSQSIQP